jgi:hypothetical protein
VKQAGLVLLIFLGCSDASSGLMGQWDLEKAITQDGKVISSESYPGTFSQEVGGAIGLEFFGDKSFRYQNGSGGKWDILGDGRIKLAMSQGGIILGTTKDDTLMIEVMGSKFFYRKKR